MANETSLDALSSLLKLFQGTKSTQTTSGGGSSSVSQTQMDPNILAGLLKNALESNQGLAAVTSGQKQAGLYNSSTNSLLANDLLARMTVQTAAAGAPTVKTTTSAPQVTSKTEGGLANQGVLGPLMLGMTAYKKLSDGKDPIIGDIKKAGQKVLDVFNQGSPAEAPAAYGSDVVSPINWDNIPMQPGYEALSNISAGGSDVSPDVWDAFDAASKEYYDFFSSGGGEAAADTASSVGDSLANFSGASAGNAPSTAAEATTVAGSIASTNLGSGVTGSIFSNAGTTAGYAGGDLGSGISGSIGSTAGADSFGSGVSGSINTNFAPTDTAGSILSFVGPVMSAFNAPQSKYNPDVKDYRHAIGSGVLSYFGMGWASPFVHMIAEPLTDAMIQGGNEINGVTGSMMMDPIGSLASGAVSPGDALGSLVDPTGILGIGDANSSEGGLVGMLIDPAGALLGDSFPSAANVASQVIDSVNKLDPIGNAVSEALGGGGRVVCTELAYQGKISQEKYLAVLQPGITLEGRILLGYHMLGIPMVRAMRRNPKFTDRILPYAEKYLDYKLGKFSWTGFFIKHIGEPICWILSFFNKDPEGYKTLYPYRRARA